MTITDFNKLKFCAGMRISHTCTFTTAVTIHNVVSVNFAEHTFGVDDGDLTECEYCHEDTPIITWLCCDNCEMLTEK